VLVCAPPYRLPPDLGRPRILNINSYPLQIETTARPARLSPYGTTIVTLLVLAAILLAYPLARMFWDVEIENNEGWNAYLQIRAMAGLPIYDLGSPLVFNNYPPLSFYLIGALSTLFHDPQFAGRLASVIGLGAIAASCGSVVRSAGGSAWDGRLAMATCLLVFVTMSTDRIGMNDPQLMGQAFVTAGLALHVAGKKRPALVALLFAAGVLTKHNLVVVPVVVAIDVLWRGPARARIEFFAVGLSLAAISFVALWLTAGPTFFAQLLASRAWDGTRGLALSLEVFGRLEAGLAIVGITLVVMRRQRPALLVLAYLVLSMALATFFAGGAGTDVNIYFDVFIALSMGAGLTAHWLGKRRPKLRVGIAVAINIGAIVVAPLCLGRAVVEGFGDMAENERGFQADAAYLRAIPGPVLCQSLPLCFRAGKPMTYDALNVNQAMIAGRLPADTLTGMLRRHEIAVFQISAQRIPPGTTRPWETGRVGAFAYFPNDYFGTADFQSDVFDALDQEYVVDRVGVTGRFMRPRG
jgi:hypothetical protein